MHMYRMKGTSWDQRPHSLAETFILDATANILQREHSLLSCVLILKSAIQAWILRGWRIKCLVRHSSSREDEELRNPQSSALHNRQL